MIIVVKVERYSFTLPECIQKVGDGIANSVDPDQTAPRSSLFWVCTVCSDLSVPILRTFTVVYGIKMFHKNKYIYFGSECQMLSVSSILTFLSSLTLRQHTGKVTQHRDIEDNSKIIFLISQQKHVVTPH